MMVALVEFCYKSRAEAKKMKVRYRSARRFGFFPALDISTIPVSILYVKIMSISKSTFQIRGKESFM